MRLAAQRRGIKKPMWSDHSKHGLQRMASNQGHLCQLYCFVSDFIVLCLTLLFVHNNL
jgi:hypothetical protein